MERKFGAYVLPGDTTWLAATLRRYYPLLDELVVPVPRGGIGWTGRPLPVGECVRIVKDVDVRGIARFPEGEWVYPDEPMRGETEQRQFSLGQFSPAVDWVIQLDSDELLPDPSVLKELARIGEEHDVNAVEAPMRVLYRRTRRHVLEVCGSGGSVHHEYPGAVLVRPRVKLVEARRVEGRYARVAAAVAADSLQLRRPPDTDEVRVGGFDPDAAIVHNSWARSPREIKRKLGSWGHSGARGLGVYYWTRWFPSPLFWRILRNVHPFSDGLWPGLRRWPSTGDVADPPTSENPTR